MTITHLDIVSIPVKDQQVAKAFYVDKLGFEVRSDNDFMPGARWIEIAPPGSLTRFTLVTWFENMPAGVLDGLVLESTDVEADYALLKGRGVEVTPLENAPWGHYTTFKDPDGNGWVLQHSVPFG
jgi:catechol 2,3-dioxygenase-like lactoylglutathione lyase family enzyme